MTHFPDPMGLRDTVASWTLGVYPNCLKCAMAIFDVPETIAVTRKLLCQSGVASVSRVQVNGFLLASCKCYCRWLAPQQSKSDPFSHLRRQTQAETERRGIFSQSQARRIYAMQQVYPWCSSAILFSGQPLAGSSLLLFHFVT